MKLFVTGICGRLGSAIAMEASSQAHTVVGLDQAPWSDSRGAVPPGIEIVNGSYEDFPLVKRLLQGCDAVLHTAGFHGSHVEKVDLAGFLRANVESVGRLLELALQAGARSVALSSTMEIQLGRDWTTSGMAIVDEESPAKCDSAYSISRLLVEHLGREFARNHPVSIASLRYMCFGYQPDKTLGPQLLARSLSVRDVARAVIRAATMGGLKGEVFNIGPETPLTNQDIIAAMRKPEAVLERYFPGATEVLKAAGFELHSTHFWPATSIRKAQLILGWAPQYTFETCLREHGWRGKRVYR